MERLSILYIGDDGGTSRHRAMALRRLGNDVFIVNPFAFLHNNHLAMLWAWKTGGLLLEDFVRRRLLATVRAMQFDLVIVTGGELVGPSLVAELKDRFKAVVNYNNDDPFGGRDGQRWRLYFRALPVYDLAVVMREPNVREALARGAQRVLRILMSADEVAHSPRRLVGEDRQKWASDVVFVGTWMPERGPFMSRLIKLGVPLSIYGNRWQRAPEWQVISHFWRGPALNSENDYAKAIQCSRVSLGLLSKGNRDLTTQRSFEIPLLGGVLCAERTSEHLALYRENEEAVFWKDPEECAEKCIDLLNDDEKRKRIAANGRTRCIENGNLNEKVMAQIVRETFGDELRDLPRTVLPDEAFEGSQAQCP